MKFSDDKQCPPFDPDPAKNLGRLFMMPDGEFKKEPLMLIQYAAFKYRLVDLRQGNRYEDHDVTEVSRDWIDVTANYEVSRVYE